MNTCLKLSAGAILFFFAFASPAYAYIDPGTGSMLLQALIGGFAIVAVFWRRVIDKLRQLLRRGKNSEPE